MIQVGAYFRRQTYLWLIDYRQGLREDDIMYTNEYNRKPLLDVSVEVFVLHLICYTRCVSDVC